MELTLEAGTLSVSSLLIEEEMVIAPGGSARFIGRALVFADEVINQGSLLLRDNAHMERRFRVTNLGPGASTGSTFTIPSMSGVTFSANGTGASGTSTAGMLTCIVGAVASGASTEFVVLFNAPAAAGVYSNTMRIRGNDWDNVSSNNTAPWTLTVN